MSFEFYQQHASELWVIDGDELRRFRPLSKASRGDPYDILVPGDPLQCHAYPEDEARTEYRQHGRTERWRTLLAQRGRITPRLLRIHIPLTLKP